VRLLLVEDDAKLARAVGRRLRHAGYAVDVAGDGEAALMQAAVWDHDAIVLDVMLPSRDGFEVCRTLRERDCWVPILMLTARGQVGDRIRGLIDLDRIEDRLVVPCTGDEVAHLATTLNAMLDRIGHGVEEQHRLVADASHELRTPLAAMRCEIDVSLRADDLPPAARQVLESAREEVDRMTRTVDDLLVLASLDEGRLELVVEPLDLHVVVARAVASLDPLARTRGVSLGVDGSAAMALGDAARLGQAVRNLVENAIKFSPEGGEVVVTTWAADGEVGVTVRDQGPGVALEVRERIFDRFFRADPSRTRSTGGGGRGLAISREIALAHAGRVWVDDAGAHGSAFSLALAAR
jgi:signal transduction histidine kinase